MRDVVGIGVLKAEVVLLDEVQVKEHVLEQLLSGGLFLKKKCKQLIHFWPEMSTFTLSDRKSDDDNKTQRMIVYRAWLKGFCQVW